MTNGTGVIGTEGFVAWFYAIIYNRVRKACENIFIKIFVHIIGLTSMIIGLYFLMARMPPLSIAAGIFFIMGGLVIFLTPIGVE